MMPATRSTCSASVGVDRAVIASHQSARAKSRQQIDRKYAALRGITLVYLAGEVTTDLALGVLREIEGDSVPFIRAAAKRIVVIKARVYVTWRRSTFERE